MKRSDNRGMLLLGVWLLLTGAVQLLNVRFDGLGVLMAGLAIAAGALIVVGR